MNRYQYFSSVAVAVLVAPAVAQEQQITVADYILSQQALLGGVTELLNLPTIAEDPDSVAAAIEELTKYAVTLVSLKSELNAEELAIAQGNLESDPAAQAVGSGFISAVNQLNARQFYNSQRLATALQNFAAALSQM